MHPDQILAKLDSVTKSETFAILKKFLNVLDNCGQLVARLPQSIYQPCFKFVGRTDEPRWINDAYVMPRVLVIRVKANTYDGVRTKYRHLC